VLLLGHFVPVPVAVRMRKYDEAFYEAMTHEDKPKSAADAMKDLFDD
jgi:hypothetical protein